MLSSFPRELQEAYPHADLQYFPHTVNTGVFAFHCAAFETGEPATMAVNYQADGLDNYFHLSARRVGQGLLVSFTDTADQPRSPVELALREAQAAETAARAEAEAQRQQLHDVLQQAPVAIALLEGPCYRITLANPTVCQLWDRPLSYLLGKALLDALPELQGQGVDTLLDGVLDTGVPFIGTELPFQVVRQGQPETIYFNFVYQPQRDAHGNTSGVLVVATDVTSIVTARQQVEAKEEETAALNEELASANEEIRANNEQLHLSQLELLSLNQELEARVQQRTFELSAARAVAEEQRHRLERLFQQAPAAICIFSGPTLDFDLVNPVYQAFFPDRPLLGKALLDALPELADHTAYHTMCKVYETGETNRQPALHTRLARTPGGPLEDRYFNYIQQPRYDEHGRIDGVLVFGLEVTEQVQVRQRVEASAQQLRLLTDALPVLIGYLDQERRYQFANEAYRAWFNQDPAALLGRSVREIVGEKAYAATSGYMDRALAGERLDFEATMPYREGFVRHIRTSYVPDLREGRVLGFYTLVTDVTEQVEGRKQVERLNQELQATNEQLVRTNVDLDNFIYTASHDLKAPISNMEGLLYLLQQELPPEVAQDAEVGPILARMLDSVERFKRTIDHLTEVSKLQKEHTPSSTAVSLAAVIEDVCQDLALLLQETGARLVVDVDALPPIHFSEKNLRSIVYNLLSNALKYRHPDRTLHVDLRAYLRAGLTVLEVHDNGLGLAPEHLRKLFTMFQRFHVHVEGSGIGLYMVKRIVENAGGRIEVHSQLGVGTTFFVYLPQAGAA